MQYSPGFSRDNDGRYVHIRPSWCGLVFIALLLSLMFGIRLFISQPSASALTTVPTQMNFQGRLTDSAGNIKPNGNYNMRLKLYTVNSGGSPVWSEDRLVSAGQGIPVTNGLFSLQLGSLTPLPASLFASGPLYLEVELASPATATSASPTWSEGPMTPRNQLATSAYAYNAETLDGLDSSAFAAASGSSSYIQNTTTPQTANLNIQGAAGSSPVAKINFGSSTGDLLQVGDEGLSGFVVDNIGDNKFYGDSFFNSFAVFMQGIYADTIDTNYGSTTLDIGSVSGGNATNINLNVSTTVAANQTITMVGGVTAMRPASPTEGMIYFDSQADELLVYAAGSWQSLNGGGADGKTATKIVAASNSPQAIKDVADYVADGNTATPGDGDQVQINAALTAAAGGYVYLAEGNYVADATILIPNNTTLAGAGQGTVIELADLDVDENLIENSNTAAGTGVTLRGMKLDGRKDLNTAGTQNGVYLNGMGGGSGASARQGAKLTDLGVFNFRAYGFYLNSSSNNALTGNTAQSNGFYGFNILSSSNNALTGNTAQGNSSLGFSLGSSSNNNTLTGNTAQGSSSNGFSLFSSSNNTLTGNTAQGNNNYGFYLNFNVSNNTVTGNTLTNNGGNNNNDAIYLTAADSNTITSNTITDSSATTTNYAINISDNTSNTNYLADNTLGGGSVRDLGTGTIYGGQVDASGNFTIQPAGNINLNKNTVVSAGSLTLGNATTAGSLVVSDGSSNTATIQVANLAGNYTYTIPVTAANDTFCLQTLANCGGGGVTTVGALDTAGYKTSANGATISGPTVYLQSASVFYAGLINTGTQTLAGNKTFVNDTTLGSGSSTTTIQGYLNFSSNCGSIAFAACLAINQTPGASSTVSLMQLGSAIQGGNAVANGGTYLGLNAPTSGAGSAADFLNFQRGGISQFKVDKYGTINAGDGHFINGVTAAGIEAALGFNVNGTAGSTITCAGGQFLQNQVVQGGIVTGGTCAAAASGGVATIGALDGGTYSANGASISGTTMYLQAASGIHTGLVTTGTQTFAGDKTFTGAINTLSVTTTNGVTVGGGVNITQGLTVGSNFTLSSGTANIIGNLSVANGSSFYAATITANNQALKVTGAPSASATSSQIQIGSAIQGGNALTNGGTYLGLNAPSSGAGSVADFLNFQKGGTSMLRVDSYGMLTAAGGGSFSGGLLVNNGSLTADVANVTLTGNVSMMLNSPTVSIGGVLSGSSTINAVSGFKFNGAAGSSITCAGGQFLQNQVVQGGIVTGGTCAAAASGGVATIGALDGGTYSANGASISGTTMYLQAASGIHTGLVTTGAQTFAGDKTFDGNVYAHELFSFAGITLQGVITNNITPYAYQTAVELGGPIQNGNANGTYYGINSDNGYAGDFLNFQNNGTSMLRVDGSGNTTAAGTLTVSGSGTFGAVYSGSGNIDYFTTKQIVANGYTSGSAGIFSGSSSNNNPTLVAKQAGSSTADLLQAQNSSGTALFSVSASGSLMASGTLQVQGTGSSSVAGSLGVGSVDVTTVTGTLYNIGDTGPAGGKIFYDKGDFSNGWRYMEAATADLGARYAWGCMGTSLTGADSVAIGTGQQNTADIAANCADASTAAKMAAAYAGGGRSDWFLPSRDELVQMYAQRASIGGFTTSDYASSSEYDINDTWFQDFDFATPSHYDKSYTYYVRPARYVTDGTTSTTTGESILYVDDVSNRIGIGTTSPGSMLQVAGDTLINTTSATALRVQNAGGSNMFSVDTAGTKVTVGSTTTDATAVLFVVDSYSNATDPAGVNGAMYYNSSMDRFRCYENGVWRNCTGISANGVSTATQSMPATTDTYIAGSGVALPTHGLTGPTGSGGNGTLITWKVYMTKTAVAGLSSTLMLRAGTTGTTADASRCMGMPTGNASAVVDSAVIIVTAYATAGGATATLNCSMTLTHQLTSSGFSTLPMQQLYSTQNSFDSTPAGTTMGLSFTAGSGNVITIQKVEVSVSNL